MLAISYYLEHENSKYCNRSILAVVNYRKTEKKKKEKKER